MGFGNQALAGKCATCAHFRNEPDFLEREIPGLASMSSAHASVRADDGICTRHDRYLSARASCADFTPLQATGAGTSPAAR